MDATLDLHNVQATEKGGCNELARHDGEMDMSVEAGGNQPPPLQLQAGGPPPLQLQAGGPPPLQLQAGGPPPLQLQAGGPPPLQLQAGGPPPLQLQVDGPLPLQLHLGGRNRPLQPLPVEVIPEDPAQAETHYSQVSC